MYQLLLWRNGERTAVQRSSDEEEESLASSSELSEDRDGQTRKRVYNSGNETEEHKKDEKLHNLRLYLQVGRRFLPSTYIIFREAPEIRLAFTGTNDHCAEATEIYHKIR